ncbi:hypothetical protein [Thermocrispum municipale]|uniref:hypothetical protein n=1 Tax=Thermocrispum municipale TaxID=37926 RepID=UPI00048A453C|nr:hypothetical protein [Thermocrispum municipale]
MCVASATLVVWSSAWLAGRAAADDVLDAMQVWAERHELEVADPRAAELTELAANCPVPFTDLLPVLRRLSSPMALVLPAPGDPRGLDAGGPFTKAALQAGEAVVLPDAGIGLTPRDVDGLLRWHVHHLVSSPVIEHVGLAQAEEELTTAVRDSAAALAELQVANERPDADDALRAHLRARPPLNWPDGMPGRSLRVLQRADEVAAILSLANADDPGGALSASAAAHRAAALRGPAAAVRTARTAAVAEAARILSEQPNRR